MGNKETLNLAIIANSNKRCPDNSYGRCIAAVSLTGEWIRIVEDAKGNSIPMTKAQGLSVGTIIQAEVERVPLKYQNENAILLKHKYIKDNITQYVQKIKSVNEVGIFGNTSNQLLDTEIKCGIGTLRYVNVDELLIYWLDGNDVKDSKCKAKFVYQGHLYDELAMTDPNSYPAKGKTRIIGKASIVVSLPNEPPFYKFVAAVLFTR